MVQETDRERVTEGDLNKMVEAVQAALVAHHGIQADSIVLVQPRSIPVTSSGKVQRGVCRQRFLDRGCPTVAEWHAPRQPAPVGILEQAAVANIVQQSLVR